MKFSATKHLYDNKWDIWEYGEPETPVCSGVVPSIKHVATMSVENVLDLFNQIVPHTVEEPFMVGNEDCVHSWKPWKFNDKFMICSKCPAMRKIKRLVPLHYEE